MEGLYLELLGDGLEKTLDEQRLTVRRIASLLGIRVHFVNRKKEFKSAVMDYFKDSYKKGLTPNPCVFCNPGIKFKTGIEYAKRLGFDFFATGHYARIRDHARFGKVLLRGKDAKKDQSYFLYRLERMCLPCILFPLGEFSKAETRSIARKTGLYDMVLEESQEVCFIKGDYREFLGTERAKGGPIVLKATGETVGWHKGLFNYTVGQRRGLGIPGKEPYYVLELDVQRNCVYIGTKSELFKREFRVKDVNWLCPKEYALQRDILIKIRSRHQAAPGKISGIEKDGCLRVVFDSPQGAITPGQSAVFYDDSMVLGGGIICSSNS